MWQFGPDDAFPLICECGANVPNRNEYDIFHSECARSLSLPPSAMTSSPPLSTTAASVARTPASPSSSRTSSSPPLPAAAAAAPSPQQLNLAATVAQWQQLVVTQQQVNTYVSLIENIGFLPQDQQASTFHQICSMIPQHLKTSVFALVSQNLQFQQNLQWIQQFMLAQQQQQQQQASAMTAALILQQQGARARGGALPLPTAASAASAAPIVRSPSSQFSCIVSGCYASFKKEESNTIDSPFFQHLLEFHRIGERCLAYECLSGSLPRQCFRNHKQLLGHILREHVNRG